ncbi:paraquat-inducible membrane protein A [Psychromonas sp. psych-6C06]|uniref:paraquat-inducible protein A n=1 Tax=Psychromonas sp. psych-6C06 TaxID=2058089 RepID=UPI000C33E407|nr:paraquat-inducible protein A [Psychromonas sp. psych-6C06]PKF61071.1 paraquat-inducible membrane protein A [Psychromonas sp. psych-6C06]
MTKEAIAGQTGIQQSLQVCAICGNYSAFSSEQLQCPTCGNDIYLRKHKSLQKTWALLITAIVFIFPANLYPITYLLKNNILYPDTIFSGIITLIEGEMLGIAIIVFIASILVPIFKIVALIFIVIAVQRRWQLSARKQLIIFSFVDWIGRWSILDLFVISIMVAVFDKGNLLSVYPGIAATSFTIVVITTLFAAYSFDTRLIWDARQRKTPIHHQQHSQDCNHND